MTHPLSSSRKAAAAALALAGTVFWAGPTDRATGQDAGGQLKPVIADAGSVFAYVLTGAIRSENSATDPAKVYKAGESFCEPPGSEHLVSENASATEPASLVAVFVADDGPRLTTFDK